MNKNFDVAIVGAGPAGLYCAYKLITEIEACPRLKTEDIPTTSRL